MTEDEIREAQVGAVLFELRDCNPRSAHFHGKIMMLCIQMFEKGARFAEEQDITVNQLQHDVMAAEEAYSSALRVIQRIEPKLIALREAVCFAIQILPERWLDATKLVPAVEKSR